VLIMYQEFKRTIQILGEMAMFQQLSSLLKYIDRQVEEGAVLPFKYLPKNSSTSDLVIGGLGERVPMREKHPILNRFRGAPFEKHTCLFSQQHCT